MCPAANSAEVRTSKITTPGSEILLAKAWESRSVADDEDEQPARSVEAKTIAVVIFFTVIPLCQAQKELL
jgi:hypothetical protein